MDDYIKALEEITKECSAVYSVLREYRDIKTKEINERLLNELGFLNVDMQENGGKYRTGRLEVKKDGFDDYEVLFCPYKKNGELSKRAEDVIFCSKAHLKSLYKVK